MIKHTPAPWVWGQNYNGLFSPAKSEILNYEPYEGMWLSFENREANARLIAAAPELLEALKEFDDSFCDFDPASKESRSRMRLSLIKARAAIKKATGEQA